MQMMTRSNDHGVDPRIADEALFIGSTVAKSELLRGVMGMGSIGGAHTHQCHTTNSFYCRQQRTGGEVARPQQYDGDRFRTGNRGCSGLLGQVDAPRFLGKLRVSNQDSEERLRRLPLDEVVCRLRLLN